MPRQDEPSELRTDVLRGGAVILAPRRSARPQAAEDTAPASSTCPFCPGREHETPPAVLELPAREGGDWFVRVFPNRFPIVAGAGERPPAPAAGAVNTLPVRGAHEVVVETPTHTQEMAERTPEEVGLTLAAYRDRLQALTALRGIRHVAVFKNKGAPAGTSLPHPHSQIVALSYVPGAVQQAARRWKRHYGRTGRCLLCDQLSETVKSGDRLIIADDRFAVYAPPAAQITGEVVLAPLHHQPAYATLAGTDIGVLAEVLHSSLRRLKAAFGDPAYNLVLHTWFGRQAGAATHWYLRIVPRLAVLGGFELATSDFVSTRTPEAAAGLYRSADA